MASGIVAQYTLLFNDLASSGLLRAATRAQRLQGSLRAAGKAMALLSIPIAGAGLGILKVAGDFEEAMNGVSAVSGAVGAEFDALRAQARELGASTAFSATEAANGMEFLAMAGMNTQQVISTIPNALDLAAAGNLELAETADIMSNIMTGMGIAAEDSARVADVLAAASAGANVDVGMLGETMKYVAPVAKQLGLSLEETAAMAGMMGNAGIQASMAGTALRSIGTRIAVHPKAAAALDALGVAGTDAAGNVRAIPDILRDVAEATEGMTSGDKLNYAKMIAGQEAMAGWLSMVDASQNGDYDGLEDGLKNSLGTAKEMAAIRMKGLKGSLKAGLSAVQDFAIGFADLGGLEFATDFVTQGTIILRDFTARLPEIQASIAAFFDGIANSKLGQTFEYLSNSFQMFLNSGEGAGVMATGMSILRSAFEGMQGAVVVVADKLADFLLFLADNSEVTIAVASGIAAMAGAFVMFEGAMTGIAIGINVFKGLSAALAVMTSPIGLVVLAIGALVAVGVLLYRNWDMIKAKAVEVFNSLPAPVQTALSVIGTIISTGWELIKNAFSTAFAVIKALVAGDMQGVVSAIGTGFVNAVLIVGQGVANILGAFAGLAAKLYNVGVQAVQGLINGVKAKITGAIDIARNLASSVSDTVMRFFDVHSPSRLFRWIGGYLPEGLGGGISDKASVAVSAASSMAGRVADAVSGISADMMGRFTGFDVADAMAQANSLSNQLQGSSSGIADSLLSDFTRDANFAAESRADLMMTHRLELDINGKIDGAQAQVNTAYTSSNSDSGSNMPVSI